MKIKKLISIAIIGVMTIGCMTGCSKKVTAESLMDEYSDLVTNAESMTIDTELVLSMNVGDDSTTMELKMDGKLKSAIVRENEENYTSKTKSNMNVSMLGVTEKVKVEQYDSCTDGEIITYSHDLDNDIWDTTYSYIEDTPNQLDRLKNYVGAFELEKKTKKIGKNDCYVLHGILTGNDMMGEMINELELDLDADEFQMNCTLYLNKENHEPVRMEMMMDESLLGKEMDFDDYTMSITEFSINMDFSKINSTSEIKIPEEAKKSYYNNEDEPEDIDYDDNDFFVEPEEDENPIKESEDETETFEVGNPNMGTSGLNSLENKNLNFRAYEVPAEYGGVNVYVLGINTSSEDKSVYVEMQFCKNNQIIDTSSRYVDMEEGCYNIVSSYITEEYDEIKFNLTEETVYNEFAGSQIDVDYTFGNGSYSGIITNNTQETISYPEVGFVIWGENKEILEFQDFNAEASELAPGASCKFSGYYNYEEQIKDFNFYVTGTVKK